MLGTPNGAPAFAVGQQPPGTGLARRRWWLVAGLACLVATAAATVAVLRDPPASSAKSESSAVIVVVPFENRTNAPAMARFGDMIADWVAQGLARTGALQVVDSRTAITAAARASTDNSAGDASARARAVAEWTNAGVVVAGAYYRVGDSVRIQTEITDPRTGRLLRAVDPITAPLARSTIALEQVRQKVGGALATIYDARLAGIAASPNPTADIRRISRVHSCHRSEMRDHDLVSAIEHHLRAAALDPNFPQPLIWAMWDLGGLGQPERADSIGRVLEDAMERLSPYDRASVAWQRARLRCDFANALPAAQEGVRASPGSQDGLWALQDSYQMLNRPREAAEVWTRIGPGRGIYSNEGGGYAQNAAILHSAGDHDAELTLARAGRRQFSNDVRALGAEINALAALGREREVLARVDTMLAMSNSTPGMSSIAPLWGTAMELRVHGQVAAAGALFERVVREYEVLRRTPERDVLKPWAPQLYYDAGHLDKARALAAEMAAHAPNGVREQGVMGFLAAVAGDRQTAQRAMARLDTLRQPFDPGPGLPFYWRARIALALGERDTAVRFLREAYETGLCLTTQAVHRDRQFHALRDYPPFRDLVRPRG